MTSAPTCGAAKLNITNRQDRKNAIRKMGRFIECLNENGRRRSFSRGFGLGMVASLLEEELRARLDQAGRGGADHVTEG